jgi:hypothetical protein
MANRVTATEVKAIMDGVTLADAIIDSYIIGANTIVTDNLATSGLSTAMLKEIERWLAAHLVAITRERTAKKEGAGGASIEYTGDWGEGFSSTSYGQTAVALDSTGTLAGLTGKSASIYAVPTTY